MIFVERARKKTARLLSFLATPQLCESYYSDKLLVLANENYRAGDKKKRKAVIVSSDSSDVYVLRVFTQNYLLLIMLP